MEIERIEEIFETPVLDTAFFDGKPGLDVETKVILKALFWELRATDYCGGLPDSDYSEGYWYD